MPSDIIKHTKMPTLSVVVPVFNCAPYVGLALRSVLSQSFTDLELIVIDDGSSDSTGEIVSRLARDDLRVRYLRQRNGGIVSALQSGITLASAQYIARMDGDDVCHVDRFKLQLEYLKRNAHVGLVASQVVYIDQKGRYISRSSYPTEHTGVMKLLERGVAGVLRHPSVMFRRNCFDQVGGYRSTYNYVEDYDLFVRMSSVTKFAVLDSALLAYRLHSGGTNYNRFAQQSELLGKCMSEHAESGLLKVSQQDICAILRAREFSLHKLNNSFLALRSASGNRLLGCLVDILRASEWRLSHMRLWAYHLKAFAFALFRPRCLGSFGGEV